MAKTLCFDETDKIADIIKRFHKVSLKSGMTNEEFQAGESTITTFYSELCESHRLGNQAHFEKTIRTKNFTLQIIAISRSQRSLLSLWWSKISGD